MKDEITQLKTNNDMLMGENEQLLTVLRGLALDNDSQVEKITSLNREITFLNREIVQLKIEVQNLKVSSVAIIDGSHQ